MITITCAEGEGLLPMGWDGGGGGGVVVVAVVGTALVMVAVVKD